MDRKMGKIREILRLWGESEGGCRWKAHVVHTSGNVTVKVHAIFIYVQTTRESIKHRHTYTSPHAKYGLERLSRVNLGAVECEPV